MGLDDLRRGTVPMWRRLWGGLLAFDALALVAIGTNPIAYPFGPVAAAAFAVCVPLVLATYAAHLDVEDAIEELGRPVVDHEQTGTTKRFLYLVGALNLLAVSVVAWSIDAVVLVALLGSAIVGWKRFWAMPVPGTLEASSGKPYRRMRTRAPIPEADITEAMAQNDAVVVHRSEHEGHQVGLRDGKGLDQLSDELAECTADKEEILAQLRLVGARLDKFDQHVRDFIEAKAALAELIDRDEAIDRRAGEIVSAMKALIG